MRNANRGLKRGSVPLFNPPRTTAKLPPLCLTPALPTALAGGRLQIVVRTKAFVEESEDAFVFVGPTVGAVEGVVFDGVGGQLPVLFAQLDEALGEADGVLEVHVGVHHAVADEQRALEPCGEVDGRAASVGVGVVLRLVEDVGGVWGVVWWECAEAGAGRGPAPAEKLWGVVNIPIKVKNPP